MAVSSPAVTVKAAAKVRETVGGEWRPLQPFPATSVTADCKTAGCGWRSSPAAAAEAVATLDLNIPEQGEPRWLLRLPSFSYCLTLQLMTSLPRRRRTT